MSKNEYTIKEAATLLNKSVRTIRRYIDNLDKVDKKKFVKVVKGKFFLSPKFIEIVQSGHLATLAKGKKRLKQEKKATEGKFLDYYKSEVKRLTKSNDELLKMVKSKDDVISNKDQDFKALVSAITHLQHEIKELGAAPKDDQVNREPSTKDTMLFFSAMFIVGLLAVILVLLFQ